MQFFQGLMVVTKIRFAANKDDGKTGAEVKNFGDPLSRTDQPACTLSDMSTTALTFS